MADTNLGGAVLSITWCLYSLFLFSILLKILQFYMTVEQIDLCFNTLRFCFHVLLSGLWHFQFLWFFFPSGIFRHYFGILREKHSPCKSPDIGFMWIHNHPFYQQTALTLGRFFLTLNISGLFVILTIGLSYRARDIHGRLVLTFFSSLQQTTLVYGIGIPQILRNSTQECIFWAQPFCPNTTPGEPHRNQTRYGLCGLLS